MQVGFAKQMAAVQDPNEPCIVPKLATVTAAIDINMAEKVSKSHVHVTTEPLTVHETQQEVTAQPKQTPGHTTASLVAADSSSEESISCKKSYQRKWKSYRSQEETEEQKSRPQGGHIRMSSCQTHLGQQATHPWVLHMLT